MLVLIDASGSMLTTRVGGVTRFIAARDLSRQRVIQQAAADIRLLVAVYTFRGTSLLIPHTGGAFVDPNVALGAIDALNNSNAGGSTPLAGALCDSADQLFNPAFISILQVSSDGLENSTPGGHPCAGPGDPDGQPPYPEGTWQDNVLAALAGRVNVRVDLFDSSQIAFGAGLALTPLEAFFRQLALVTGGTVSTIYDDEPAPVPGDLNGDRCVDRADAILVARAFGPVPPLSDGRYDLDGDGLVSYADYKAQVSRITGACGPDRYATVAPVVCTSGQQIVVDGGAVDSSAISIDARGTCEVTIRNSVIVAGYTGITMRDRSRIVLDNSLVIGFDTAVVQFGRGVLSAGTTTFRGDVQLKRPEDYVDRGGNVFE
jgi:hypothetical protein